MLVSAVNNASVHVGVVDDAVYESEDDVFQVELVDVEENAQNFLMEV